MSSGIDWSAVESARTGWRQADAQVPRLRAVHGDLSTLHDAVARNKPNRANPDTVLAELDRLGGDSGKRREALSFLTEPLFEGDRALLAAFRHGRALTTDADAVASALAAYVDGGEWADVRNAVADIVDPVDGPMAIDSTALGEVVTLFGLAIEAGVAARETRANDLSTALADVYTGSGDPIADLEEQPIAMLPVRLETRFVDENRTTEGEPSDLLVRVFPDQIHVDSHEEELTDDEARWGQNFWATLWYARHPDPSKVPDDPDADYLTRRLPNRRLRELVADIDPAKFSDQHHKRYEELKERAWKQLLDRFGRERAAYVVHALEPTDDDLSTDLLTAPDPPPEVVLADPVVQADPVVVQQSDGDSNGDDGSGQTSGAAATSGTDAVDVSGQIPSEELTEVQSPSEIDVSNVDIQGTDQSADTDKSTAKTAEKSGDESTEDGESQSTDRTDEPLPEQLPELSFPTVPRRPSSWTQQPRAELLPDRWVAIGEWEDGTGKTQRTAVAGAPIREPLPVGPSPESVAEDELANEERDSPAPERTEWMVDFDEARNVGMGLRMHLSGLSGFDPSRGFDRLLVVGVKASLDADATPDWLVDLLDAHHYTDGLEFLEQGTPTNNHDDASGYSRADDPLESMAVECVPPLVESDDRSDGDLLARALAIDSDGDHVFANIENADGTQQRDARHMNSALWPATLGYFFQDLLHHNKFTDNESIAGQTSTNLTGSRRRDALAGPMLWHDAYRRHFVRYVRGQGPFPAMRVGKQPYGVLPTKAIETDIDVTVVDHMQVAQLERGDIELADLEKQGTTTSDLVDAGVSPGTLVEAGANPDEVLDAGADPTTVVAGATSPESAVDARELVPDPVTQDGIGLLATSKITKERLEAAGVPTEELEQADVTPRDLARGEVTQEQLSEAGVTTEAIAEVVLPEEAKSLGITPTALERAGVTPAAVLRGEITAEQVQALGLSTRTVADAVIPREARKLGITPKKLEDAGITPQDIVNGTVSAADLQKAGISTEAVAEALLPEELVDAGFTPEQIGTAVSIEDLFNGDVGFDDLQEAGLTTQRLADAVLPQSFRDAGITPESLEQAGITPDAVLNGTVTPEDVIEAGVTPQALSEAGVLPEALAEVGHAVGDLIDAGLKPAELLQQGFSPQSLVDAGLDPGLLVEAGIAPKKLVDAGVEAVELVAKGAPIGELANADVAPSELARMGATVADLAGGDVPAQDIVKAGVTAVDALAAGADALGVAEGGARPTELRSAGVDAGTLREAGKAAGSLQLAGYSARELLDAGYTPEELLNGGFAAEELTEAGVEPEQLQAGGRAVGDLLAAGHPPAELRASGYSARQLLDAGLDAAQLVAAGYTAGELTDAGIPSAELAEAGADVRELRAAGADPKELAGSGADPQSLKEAGISAETLLDQGFDPQELLDAGFESVELEIAGVDVDQLTEDIVEGEADTGDAIGAAIEGLQYAATVLEEPGQAERDLYSFSFDPALPNIAGGEPAQTGSSESGDTQAGLTDGGATAGVPVVRPLAIDDQLPGELEARIGKLAAYWEQAAHDLPFAKDTTEGGLLNALKREGLSADLRQRTMAYSGERISHTDPLNQLVRSNFDPADANEQLVGDLSRNGDFDPRLGHFHVTDETVEDVGGMASARHPLGQFYRFHLNYPTQETIQPQEMVDDDIGSFLDVLLDSTVLDAAELSNRIDLDALSVDTSVFDDETAWESLDTGQKRGRIVKGIEDADDPVGFAKQLLPGSSGGSGAPGYQKILQLGNNQASHGDSGALRSLLRLLFQHGLLREYVSARRRLGLAFDNLPDGWPDPAYYDSETTGPLSTLYDDAPEALSSHPNVGSMDSVTGNAAYAGSTAISTNSNGYRYADALQDAAADYTSTTSIDPRLSEFTDSLTYLRDIDPADMSRLARQTLDLASHRLDAWWTSLGTKRLFELREAQGTYDSEAGFDHEKWSGGGSDVPRATVDPSLLGSMDSDALAGSSTGVGATQPVADSPATDVTATDLTDTEVSGPDMADSPSNKTDLTDASVSAGDTDTSTGSTGGTGETSTGSGDTDDGKSGGTDVVVDADIAQYDPANIADTDISTTGSIAGDSGPTPDGGSGPVDDRRAEHDGQSGTTGGQGNSQPAGTASGSETGGNGGGSDTSTADLSLEKVATRDRVSNPEALHDRVQSDPGLYVGGYGFVENLAADSDGDEPEYIHAPSEQHATTAAILRSGATAHESDEGKNALSVDLSAARVRQGLRLISGVRRGQSLGALLGYRFERRLHEETVASAHEETDADAHEINLMAHLDDFRAEFPSKQGKLKRPDERKDESKSERQRELTARESLDGFRLLKRWDEYPFGIEALPDENSAEFDILDGIVDDLEDDIDAAGDLLTAESVHQLGQANYQRAGGSVGALARGEPLPEPAVAQTPRSETGVTHRQCMLFGTATADSDATPRTAAEPVLASWVETLLPPGDDVECLATYRWTETRTDPATGRDEEIEHTAETSATLSDLDLGPLGVLLLFGADREETRSELEQRLVYQLLRDRPSDPAVPDDATVELALTETTTPGAVSMADLLELARSIRDVVQSSRPVDAEDLAHPTDDRGEGYDETTAQTLTERANDAQDRLREIAEDIDERMAVLDSEHAAGDALSDIPEPEKASADGGSPASPNRAESGVTLPGDTAPASDPLSVERPTLTEQVTGLAESIRTVEDAVPLSTAESVSNAIDAGNIRSELSALLETLPAGVADPSAVDEDVTVLSAAAQTVSGRLGRPVTVPDSPTDGSDQTSGGGTGEDSGSYQDIKTEAPVIEPEQLQLQKSALGTTKTPEGTAEVDDQPEVETVDAQLYTEQVELQEPVEGEQPSGDDTEEEGGDEGDETSEDAGDGSSGSAEDQDTDAPDWSTKTATVRVWGTDGLSWFEKEAATTPDANGAFDVEFDFSDVEPGTPFHAVAVVDGTVAFSATGRVVADGGVSTSTRSTLESECPTLQQLLWLQDRRDSFAVESGPSAALDLALDGMDWDAVRAERDAVDTDASTVTQADVDAVDALLDVEGIDPETVIDSVDATVAPVNRLGLDTVVDLTGGEGPPSDLNYWFGPTAGVGDVRARISRTLDNPWLFNADAPERLLAYHHDAAATLHGMDGGEVIAAYLDAFLAQPAWTIRYLDRKMAEPATLVRDLTAWLYSPSDLSSTGDLATSVRNLAATVQDLPALTALFDGLPVGASTTRLEAFGTHLESLAAELESGTPAPGNAEDATSAFDADSKQAVTDLASGVAAERTAVSSVPDGVERSFRTMVLEQLREPMTVAASYGVYGGTPESADGGRPEDESELLEQAQALLGRLCSRLADAAALDPRLHSTMADRPVPQRVEDGTDRLETLFGDGFTVLPPFSPSNPAELRETFTDDGLIPDDRRTAAETWLQRAASFRDGVSDFREARSYAEAISGSLTPSLTVGQVPYEDGDTWVGVDGIEPSPGKLSLVAQFGPDASPGATDGPMTGLFVDEWTEGVPEDSETTGVALNYDDPGSRAPQSVLLAPPPDDGSWSLGDLASVVTETAEYAKRRAVDLGDMESPSRMFPGLYFAQQHDHEPSTPTVDFRMLDWYDRELVAMLQPPQVQLNADLKTGDESDDGNGGGS